MATRLARRALLGSAAAATVSAATIKKGGHASAATAAGVATATDAVAVRGSGATGSRIDVHCHHIPDFWRDSLEANDYEGAGRDLPDWTPELAVGFMDGYGIDAQVVSITAPACTYLESLDERRAMAAQLNDWTKEELLTTQDPNLAQRFGAFAVLPLRDCSPRDVKAACREADRAVTRLGLDGVGLLSSYNGVYLGDKRLDPLMRTLERLGVLVFVHPTTPVNAPQVGRPELPPLLLEFTFDTTRAAVNMSYRRTYSRFPGIRWLFAHAGGTLPYLSYRATLGTLERDYPAIDFDYSRHYYDTALSWGPEALLSTREVAGPRHVMYATDWPYSDVVFEEQGDPLTKVQQTFPDEPELTQVLRANALEQLPTLAARLNSPTAG